VETKSLAEILKAAVLSGLLAGLVAATFHWILTEPLIDRAVEMEERLHQSSGATHEEPVVSRPAQKVGLFFGFLLYGLAWGVLFGLLAYAIRPWLTAGGGASFFLALLLGWSVAIFPLLKFPANPPGVGEAETIGYRQGLFVGLIALSLIGATVALAAERRLSGRGKSARIAVVVSYVVYLAVIYFALPSNPDAVRLPPDLVQSFRSLSLLGQILFWGVLGAAFSWLCRRQSRQPGLSRG
jgi:predicted cobalt transporter CbtA